MTTASIKIGDIVQCDVKGRRFFAIVAGGRSEGGGLVVDAITPNISYRSVKAREIIGHYRKAAGSA
jgi:hypothetical protein